MELTFYLLLLATVSVVDNKFVELTEKNLNKQLEKYASSTLAVVFYKKENCPHCEQLLSIWDKLDTGVNVPISLARFKVKDAKSKVLESLGVTEIPSIWLYREKLGREFGGVRSLQSLGSFLQHTRPFGNRIEQLGSKSQARDWVSNLQSQGWMGTRVGIMGYFPDGEQSAEYKAYIKLARYFIDDHLFSATFSEEVAKRHNLAAKGAALSILRHGEKTVRTSKRGEEKDFWLPNRLIKWVEEQERSLLERVTHFNVYKTLLQGKTVFLGYINPNQPESTNREFVDSLHKIAKKANALSQEEDPKRKKRVYGYAYISIADFTEYFQSVGIPVQALPVAGVVETEENRHYLFNKTEIPWTVDNAVKYIQDYEHGDLQYLKKSAQAPPREENMARDVIELTRDEWDDILVGTTDYSFLVLFYTPWCKNCAEVNKIMVDISPKAKEVGVRMAQVDSYSNDLPEDLLPLVEHPPTLLLFSTEDKAKPLPIPPQIRSPEMLLEFLTDPDAFAQRMANAEKAAKEAAAEKAKAKEQEPREDL